MSMQAFLWIALIYTARVGALTAFQPNCTNPVQHVNFVSSPEVRGTMTILWSCLSVLLLCTWTIQHLSVPIHVKPTKPTWNIAVKEKALFTFEKVKWMGLTIVGPEYVLGKALAEKLAAHHSRAQFHHAEWTTTHGYFANMRGFVLRFDVAAVPTSLEPSKPDDLGVSLQLRRENGDPPYYEQGVERSRVIELDQCHRICGKPCRHRAEDAPARAIPSLLSLQPATTEIQETVLEVERPAIETSPRTIISTESGRAVDSQSPESPTQAGPDTPLNPSASRLQSTTVQPTQQQKRRPDSSGSTDEKEQLGPHKTWKGTWALSSDQVFYAYQTGIIDAPPAVTIEELSDRSKGDAVVKGGAILQITWLVLQIIARTFENLAVTLLEITVLAFAACAILTYMILWHKPQDIRIPVYIDAPRILTREQVIGLAARSPVSSMIVHQFWLHGVAIRAMADNVFPSSPGLPLRLPGMKEKLFLNPVPVGMGLGGALFGAIHFAAWNFEFPTPLERLLWRISCVLLLTLPPAGTSVYWMVQHVAKQRGIPDAVINRLLKPMAYMIMPLYIGARLFLIVEVFRDLAFPAPSVFQTVQWPIAIPHVG